jgi:hypothetical protein
MFEQLKQLRAATLAARAATGMPGISTEAARGKFRVVLVTVGKKTIVDPLSDFVPIAEAVEILRQIEADKGFN